MPPPIQGRTLPRALAFAAALTMTLSATSDAGARALHHTASKFSVAAPDDFGLSFDPKTGRYEVRSERRELRIGYRRARTRLSPAAAGRSVLRRSGVRAVRTRSSRKLYLATLADGRLLEVRKAGRRRVVVIDWIVRRGQARDVSKVRANHGRIVRSARGGWAYPLASYRLSYATRALADVVSLSWTNPRDGQTVSGASVPLEVAVIGAKRPTVRDVQFSVDGTLVASDRNAPYQATLDSTSLTNGTHRVEAVASMKGGGTVASPIVVNVENLQTTAPPPPSAAAGEPAMGTVIAGSNFEDGTSGGMNIQQCYPGDLSFPFGMPAQGNRLGTYMVREAFNEPQTGHERCETVRGYIPSQQAYYTRAWMRVPSSSQFNEWLTTIQWKTTVESGPPPLDLFLLPPKYRGYEYLSLRSGDSSTIAWNSPTIQRDKWYRIVVKTYLNPDPSKGYEEVWFGDASGVTKQVMTNGAERFYMKNAVPDSTHHFRFGIRRADANSGTTVLDYDDLSIEQVTP